MILVLGTRNEGKLVELVDLLSGIPGLELRTFHDSPFRPVEETGETFLENAALKARGVSAETGLPVLAEDAGLEVAALGGDPGVRSARFAGLPVDPLRNNALLLERLSAVTDRRARFVTVAVLRLPGGREFARLGVLEGKIAEAARGEGGFGYDPLFVPEGSARTLAEMTVEEKNRLSHRRRAIDGVKEILKALP
jgi:XTP/dITP diphosphohydrolase